MNEHKTCPRLAVACAAGKGGVGKTTLACGVASVLAASGVSTLLVDLDPQGDATWGIGVDPNRPGTAELLSGEGPSPISVAENLSVLPGGQALRNGEIAGLYHEALSDALADMGGAWDAHVFDCPPGDPHLQRLGTVAATAVLVLLDAHPFAFQGASVLLGQLEDRKHRGRIAAERWALVLSKIDHRRALDLQLSQIVRDRWPGVPQFSVRQDSALSNATADQRFIAEAPRTSRGLEDIKTIVEWLMASESSTVPQEASGVLEQGRE